MATRVSTKHYLDSEHSSSITRRLIVFPGSTTSLLPEHCRIYTVSIKIKKLSHRCKSCRDLLYLKQGQSWHSARHQFKGRKSQRRTTTTTVSCGNTSSCTSMLWLKFLKASLEWERNRDGEINAEQWQYPWFGLYAFFIPLPHTLNNPLLNPAPPLPQHQTLNTAKYTLTLHTLVKHTTDKSLPFPQLIPEKQINILPLMDSGWGKVFIKNCNMGRS